MCSEDDVSARGSSTGVRYTTSLRQPAEHTHTHTHTHRDNFFTQREDDDDSVYNLDQGCVCTGQACLYLPFSNKRFSSGTPLLITITEAFSCNWAQKSKNVLAKTTVCNVIVCVCVCVCACV